MNCGFSGNSPLLAVFHSLEDLFHLSIIVLSYRDYLYEFPDVEDKAEVEDRIHLGDDVFDDLNLISSKLIDSSQVSKCINSFAALNVPFCLQCCCTKSKCSMCKYQI